MFGQILSIGLTGGIGSGKTTVSNIFSELGVNIIDTDVIAHQICAPNGMAITSLQEHFGESYIQADGALDRTKMRHLVFTNALAKQELEHILHPLIRQEAQVAAQNGNGTYNMFIIPLLLESKRWLNHLDKVLVVDCEEETQISRVMKRNQFSRQEVLNIMASQLTRQERLQYADHVIQSEESFAHIRGQVEKLHQYYISII